MFWGVDKNYMKLYHKIVPKTNLDRFRWTVLVKEYLPKIFNSLSLRYYLRISEFYNKKKRSELDDQPNPSSLVSLIFLRLGYSDRRKYVYFDLNLSTF